MGLAHKSREPVYQKLKNTIIKEIKNGTLKENDAILSERLLTERFGISRISVRKAISELIEENFLYTVPGKGTFVKGLTSEYTPTSRRTYNIGYIHWGTKESVLVIPYFAHIIHGSEMECLKHNYHLLVSTSINLSGNDTIALPSMIKQGKVDGVILEGVDLDSWFEIKKIIPTLIISNYICEPDSLPDLNRLDYVAANNVGAMRNILEYLKENGHSKIGFIYETLTHSSFAERLHGFTTGMLSLGLTPRDEWTIRGKTGAQGMKKILEKSERPTAVIAANDTFAIDAIQACKDKGVKVPNDMSIVGFDDIDTSPWSRPALTTVRVLTEEMGKLAARRLIEKIEDPEMVPTHILVGTELIVRDSVKNLNK